MVVAVILDYKALSLVAHCSALSQIVIFCSFISMVVAVILDYKALTTTVYLANSFSEATCISQGI